MKLEELTSLRFLVSLPLERQTRVILVEGRSVVEWTVPRLGGRD